MKIIIWPLLLICFTTLAAQELDEAYHNNEEILAVLTELSEAYPEWVTLDSIGYSAEYGLPIRMVKLSDNPEQIEDEPAILLVGQVHAEEVVGVEIALEIMRLMLENNEEEVFRRRLEETEIYIIPTANPEGLDIVHSGTDLYFRKNCRDNIGDGQLRITEGAGWDTSGVDLNRNFGTHWDRGDTLFFPEVNYRYNAFRGSAPFSEPESQALRDLALDRNFVFSIVYHSSRSGNSAEMLIAPWFWRENGIIKRPPDALAINSLGEAVAGLLPKQNDPNDHYRPVQSMQRKGQLQDWFYIEMGTFQYMAEVGAEIQPDAAGMRQVVDDNLAAVWYMMDLMTGNEQLDGFSILKVTTHDEVTGEPLDASVIIDELDHPILKTRHTNQYNGRFDWMLEEGEYNISIQKLGYATQTWENFAINDGDIAVIEARLEVLEPVQTTFRTRDESSGNPVTARITLTDARGVRDYDLPVVNGELTVNLPPQQWEMVLTAAGYLPVVNQLDISGEEEERVFELDLQPASVVYQESFAVDHGWSRGGGGEDWGVTTYDERTALTESMTGDYPTNAAIWLMLEDVVHLDSTRGAVLELIHRPYFEPGDDYGQISLFTNPESITSLQFSQLPTGWDTLYLDLGHFEPGDLQIRFEVHADDAIGEDGWLIDQVTVYRAGSEGGVRPESVLPVRYGLLNAFPNPFNSSVAISYYVPARSVVSIRIYNTCGQLVDVLVDGVLAAGGYSIGWDASDKPNGLYFLKMNFKDKNMKQDMLKILLVK